MHSPLAQRYAQLVRVAVLPLALAGNALLPRQATAQALFTENFNGNTQRSQFVTAAIPNTGMTVTKGVVDVYQDQTAGGRDKFLFVRLGAYGLNPDPVTTRSEMAIAANNTFDLFAGVTYTLSFDWSHPESVAGNGPFPFSFTALLGSASLTLSDNAGFFYGYNWATAQLTFAPTVTELGAILRFAGTGVGYSGFYLDNISLGAVGTPTQPDAPAQPPAAGVVPEPSTWALLLGGMAPLALYSRRRRRPSMV